MRVMGAETPHNRLAERVEELTELRDKIDLEIRRVKAAMRTINRTKMGRPTTPRPPCGTEKGYQRHYREGEDCWDCRVAHSQHERDRYAARRAQQQLDEVAEAS